MKKMIRFCLNFRGFPKGLRLFIQHPCNRNEVNKDSTRTVLPRLSQEDRVLSSMATASGLPPEAVRLGPCVLGQVVERPTSQQWERSRPDHRRGWCARHHVRVAHMGLGSAAAVETRVSYAVVEPNDNAEALPSSAKPSRNVRIAIVFTPGVGGCELSRCAQIDAGERGARTCDPLGSAFFPVATA